MSSQPIDFTAIITAANILVETFMPTAEGLAGFIQKVTPSINAVYKVAYQKYLDAGAPYGENTDGMVRWWEELAEAERLRQAANGCTLEAANEPAAD